MSRNPISDLEAVAAMPGLEQLATVMARHIKPRRGSAADPLSILIFLAGRWAFGSANKFDSAVRSTELWETLRRSADRVGRTLPKRPPTSDQLRHLRDAADDGLVAELSIEFTKVAVHLAKQVGLLTPDPSDPWFCPSASTVIYSDGSVFAPQSGVDIDEVGNVSGSRAKENPRLGPRFKGKEGNDMLSGIPITVVGVHGRSKWQRVLLATDLFYDRNEIGSALKLLERVISEAAGGVTHIVYDGLMSGTHMRTLMLKSRVIPVVAMPNAPLRGKHYLKLPVALQRVGYKSTGKMAKDKTRAKVNNKDEEFSDKSKSKVGAPKSRLMRHHFETVSHETDFDTCYHDLHQKCLSIRVPRSSIFQQLTLALSRCPCFAVQPLVSQVNIFRESETSASRDSAPPRCPRGRSPAWPSN